MTPTAASPVLAVPMNVAQMDLLAFVTQRESVKQADGSVSYAPRFAPAGFISMQRNFEKQAFPLIDAHRNLLQAKMNDGLTAIPGAVEMQTELSAIAEKFKGEATDEEKQAMSERRAELVTRLQALGEEVRATLEEDEDLKKSYSEDIHELTFSKNGIVQILQAMNDFLFSPSTNPGHRNAGDLMELLENALTSSNATAAE